MSTSEPTSKAPSFSSLFRNETKSLVSWCQYGRAFGPLRFPQAFFKSLTNVQMLSLKNSQLVSAHSRTFSLLHQEPAQQM